MNPLNPRYSTVLLAGLSSNSTYHLPRFLLKAEVPKAQALICPATGRAKAVVVKEK